MELFVINRHGEETSQITQEEEQSKVAKVLRQIERRKQQRIRQRERQKQSLKSTPTEEPNHVKEKPVIQNGIQEAGPSEEEQTQPKKQVAVDLSSFTVLGSETNVKKAKVHRVLPQWLSNPTVISSNLQNLDVKVAKMKQLDKSIKNQLKTNGIKYFFPVQAEVIPWLLEMQKYSDVMFPRDVCVSAPTGSGKTLAFVLPVIQALKHYTVKKIRALVILPTQDLAEQVYKTFKVYAQGTNIEAGLVSGKHLFNMEQKQLGYHSESFGYVSKIDILVCTAGRLVNHLKSTQGFNLQSLEFLVIDEADRVLETVQDDWLYHLEKHILNDDYTLQNKKVLNLLSLQKKRSPQKLLFSATLSQDPEKLEKLSLFQPKLFTSASDSNAEIEDEEAKSFVGKYTTPKELKEQYIECSKDLKPLVLYEFIKRENLSKTIVFTHSAESAHRLKILLKFLFKDKLKIEEISSSLKGKSRDGFITSFSRGDVDILISTDALSRGIDLPGVKCVISYSAPKFLKTYIHRVGRTARAGELGLAVTLLHNEQMSSFKTLLGQLKKDNMEQVVVDEEELASLAKLYTKALSRLKETVRKEEKTGLQNLMSKKKSLKNDRIHKKKHDSK